MSAKRAIHIALTVLAVALCFTLMTCGGSKRAVVQGLRAPEASFSPGSSVENKTSPEGLPAGAGLDYPESISLDQTLTQLEGMECPEGVDEELWVELKDALTSQLESRFSNRDSLTDHSRLESRDSSGLGHATTVNDLAILDNGDGTFTLSWHYRNLGDYDQNGVVAVEDIIPLAEQFGEDTTPENEWIDGDSDGRVHISDITPIAINFAVNIDHYAVEGAAEEAGSYEPVDEIAQDAGTGDKRLEYSAVIESPAALWHRVVPVDSEGTAGEPSNAVLRPSNEPIIYDISPTEGYQHEEYTFSATVSGVEPLAYAWDFGGGANPDTSADLSPTVTLADAGEYAASVTVTNAYGEASFPFTLTISERDIWAHTWGGAQRDLGRDIVLMPDGSVWLLGITASFGNGKQDVLLLKYNEIGELLLSRTWGGHDEDMPYAAVGVGEVFYVAGTTKSFGVGNDDIFMLKYSKNGDLAWSRTYGTGDYEWTYDVSTDINGDVYVCGYWVAYGGNPDVLLAKVDMAGNLLWAKTWGGPGSERAYGLTVASEAVYVVGYTDSFGAGGEDVLLLKYDASGNVIWSRTWVGSEDDHASALCLDKQGNIYVAGGTYSFGAGHQDALILKYDAEGTLLDRLTWGTEHFDGLGSVTFDPNTQKLGFSGSSSSATNMYGLVALTNPGLDIDLALTWQADEWISLAALSVSKQGDFYLCGTAANSEGIWQEASGIIGHPEGIDGEVEGVVNDIVLVEGIPELVMTTPEGIIDTGGGENDVLLLKNFE